jgi:hypothetical protein
MDTVAGILKNELHRLLVDGIKYERVPGEGSVAEWEMLLFKDEELINYLKALQVEKSVYEYVVLRFRDRARIRQTPERPRRHQTFRETTELVSRRHPHR